MVLSAQEESLISVVRALPSGEAGKVLNWARQLADLADGRMIEWSDSWSDEDLAEARKLIQGRAALLAKIEKPSAIERLEEIVHLLEDGKIGLDDALGRYEEGVGLLRKAYEMLEKTERRIALLTGFDSEGNPVLRPLEDTASYSSAADASGPPPSGPEKNTPRRSRRTAEPGMF